MILNNFICIRDLVNYSVAGGWGKENRTGEFTKPVAVIRGADFPSIEKGVYSGLPIRWEKESKVKKAALCPGDIILEISGGTNSRPTGRTLYITADFLKTYSCSLIPASFCRVIRSNSVVDSAYLYYWLQDMYKVGRTWSYQNRSTGLANFQFKAFMNSEEVFVPSMVQQQRIVKILRDFDTKIKLNNRINDYLAA